MSSSRSALASLTTGSASDRFHTKPTRRIHALASSSTENANSQLPANPSSISKQPNQDLLSRFRTAHHKRTSLSPSFTPFRDLHRSSLARSSLSSTSFAGSLSPSTPLISPHSPNSPSTPTTAFKANSISVAMEEQQKYESIITELTDEIATLKQTAAPAAAAAPAAPAAPTHQHTHSMKRDKIIVELSSRVAELTSQLEDAAKQTTAALQTPLSKSPYTPSTPSLSPKTPSSSPPSSSPRSPPFSPSLSPLLARIANLEHENGDLVSRLKRSNDQSTSLTYALTDIESQVTTLTASHATTIKHCNKQIAANESNKQQEIATLQQDVAHEKSLVKTLRTEVKAVVNECKRLNEMPEDSTSEDSNSALRAEIASLKESLVASSASNSTISASHAASLSSLEESLVASKALSATLSASLDASSAANATLSASLESALTVVPSLRAANSSLLAENASLKQSSPSLQPAVTQDLALLASNASLKSSLSSALADAAAAATLLATNQSLLATNQAVVVENQTLVSSHQTLTADYQALNSTHQALNSTHQALASSHQTLTSSHQTLASSLAVSESQNQQLSLDMNALKLLPPPPPPVSQDYTNALATQRDELRAANATLTSALTVSNRQNNGDSKDLKNATRATATLTEKLAAANATAATLKQSLAESRSSNKAFRETEEHLVNTIDELTVRTENQASEINSLTTQVLSVPPTLPSPSRSPPRTPDLSAAQHHQHQILSLNTEYNTIIQTLHVRNRDLTHDLKTKEAEITRSLASTLSAAFVSSFASIDHCVYNITAAVDHAALPRVSNLASHLTTLSSHLAVSKLAHKGDAVTISKLNERCDVYRTENEEMRDLIAVVSLSSNNPTTHTTLLSSIDEKINTLSTTTIALAEEKARSKIAEQKLAKMTLDANSKIISLGSQHEQLETQNRALSRSLAESEALNKGNIATHESEKNAIREGVVEMQTEIENLHQSRTECSNSLDTVLLDNEELRGELVNVRSSLLNAESEFSQTLNEKRLACAKKTKVVDAISEDNEGLRRSLSLVQAKLADGANTLHKKHLSSAKKAKVVKEMQRELSANSVSVHRMHSEMETLLFFNGELKNQALEAPRALQAALEEERAKTRDIELQKGTILEHLEQVNVTLDERETEIAALHDELDYREQEELAERDRAEVRAHLLESTCQGMEHIETELKTREADVSQLRMDLLHSTEELNNVEKLQNELHGKEEEIAKLKATLLDSTSQQHEQLSTLLAEFEAQALALEQQLQSAETKHREEVVSAVAEAETKHKEEVVSAVAEKEVEVQRLERQLEYAFNEKEKLDESEKAQQDAAKTQLLRLVGEVAELKQQLEASKNNPTVVEVEVAATLTPSKWIRQGQEQIRASLEEKEQEINELQLELQTAQRQMSTAETPSKYKKEIGTLQLRHSSLESVNTEHLREMEVLRQKLDVMKELADTNEKNWDEAENKLEQKTEECNELHNELESARMDIEDLEEQIEEAESNMAGTADAHLAELARKNAELDAKVDEAENKLSSSLTRASAEAETKLASKDAELLTARTSLTAARKHIEEQLAATSKQLAMTSTHLIAANADLARTKQELIAARNGATSKDAELFAARKHLETFKTELAKTQEHHKVVNSESAASATEQLETKEVQLFLAENQIKELHDENTSLALALDSANDELASLASVASSAQSTRDSALSASLSSETRITSLTRDIDVKDIEITTIKREMENYRATITTLRSDIETYRASEQALMTSNSNLQSDLKVHRTKAVAFLADQCKTESQLRLLQKSKAFSDKKSSEYEDRIKLLECDKRQVGTPIKDNQRSTNALMSPEVVDREGAMKQKITQLNFELSAEQGAVAAAQQKVHNLEAMLGERNNALLKGFNNDSVVEELKGALHQAYEKYEHVVMESAEIERELRESQVREELLQEDLEDQEEEIQKLKENVDKRQEKLEQLAEDMNRAEARGEKLEEEKRMLLEDVRARMQSAEEDLMEEQRVRESRNVVWEQEKRRAAELEKNVIALKGRLERLNLEREEERVRREELESELEACVARYKAEEERVEELLEVSKKNETLLMIEANRKLLEVKLVGMGSPLTPGRFNREGGGSAFKTPGNKTLNKSLMSVGLSPMSVGKNTSVKSLGMSPFPDMREEALEAQIGALEEKSSKWQQATASLQSALDAATTSRDAYSCKASEERREKEALMKMYEKEKAVIGAELRAAFEQARNNVERVKREGVDATVVLENNEKVVELLREEAAEAKKRDERLRENFAVVSRECGEERERREGAEADFHRERKRKNLLEVQWADCQGERDLYKGGLEQEREGWVLERDVWETRLGEAESELGRAEGERDLYRGELEQERAGWAVERTVLEARQTEEVEVVKYVEVAVEKEKEVEKIVYVEKEKVVYVEKEVEREVERAGAGIMERALKTELGERDTEVQKLRKRLKEGEYGGGSRDKENSMVRGSGGGRSGGGWKQIKAREVNSSGSGSADAMMKDNVERAKQLERRFGDLSRKLTQN